MCLKRTVLFGGLALVLIVPSILMADNEDEVKHRQMLMVISKMHMRSLGLVLSGKIPHEDHLMAHARGMQLASEILPHAYPEGSVSDESAASEEIWKDRETFSDMVEKSEEASSKLVRAIKSYQGTSSRFPEKKAQRRQKIVNIFQEVKQSCRNCHKAFRE